MSLSGQPIPIVAAPRIQNATSGLIDVLNQNKARKDDKMAAYEGSLDRMRPIAEQQTISAALDPTKAALDQSMEAKINAQYERTQLDETYQAGISAQNKEFADLQSQEITKYDGQGNPIISSANQAFFEKKDAFDAEYAGYTAELDAKMSAMNEVTKATMNAGYNATNFEKEYTQQLVDSGVGLEKALEVSKAAAAQYTPAALTEAQKAAQKAEYESQQKLEDSEYEYINKIATQKQSLTNFGKIGTSGSSSSVGKNAYGLGKFSATEVAEVQKGIMDEFSNVHLWKKDNKSIIEDLFNPLYEEYVDRLSPYDVKNALSSAKQDGLLVDSLKSGTDMASLRKVLDRQVAAKEKTIAAGGQVSYGVTGNKAISADERRSLMDAVRARGVNSRAGIARRHTSKGDRSTGLSALNAATTNYNAVKANPGTADAKVNKPSGSTTKSKQLSTKDAVKKHGTDLKTLQAAIESDKVSGDNPAIKSRLQELLKASKAKKTAPTAAESKAQAAKDAKKWKSESTTPAHGGKTVSETIKAKTFDRAKTTDAYDEKKQAQIDKIAQNDKLSETQQTKILKDLGLGDSAITEALQATNVGTKNTKLAEAMGYSGRKSQQISKVSKNPKLKEPQKRKILKNLGVSAAEIEELLAQ